MARIIISFFLLIASLNSLGQVYPTITITSDKSVITSGETINFTASFSGGGTLPKLEWKKNGVIVGSNAVNFSDNTLKDGDKIACVLTSSDPQRVMNVVASNFLSPTVNPAQINPTLSGEGIVGKAITLNSNSTTSIQWFKDNIPISNQTTTLSNGSIVAGIKLPLNSDFIRTSKIFVDKCDNIYAIDVNNYSIVKFSKNSTTGNIIAGGNGRGINSDQLFNPLDVFVDSNSNIYVADQQRLLKFEPGSNTGVSITSTNFATSIYVDSEENIYYSDINIGSNIGKGSSVNKYNAKTKNKIRVMDDNLMNSNISAIYVDKNKSIYVTYFSPNLVTKYDEVTKTSIVIADGFSGDFDQRIYQPTDVFVDNELNVIISFSNKIFKYKSGSTKGEIIAGVAGGFSGASDTQLSSATSVCLNDNGDIFIADGPRIQKYEKGQSFGKTVAGNLIYNQSLVAPSSFDISTSNEIFVLDNIIINGATQPRISKWNNGTFHSLVQNVANVPTESRLTVSQDSKFFITEKWNQRITILSNDTPVRLRSYIGKGYPPGAGKDQFNNPISSFLDSLGNIYIADSQNNRIQKWKIGENYGVTVAGGNGKGFDPNQLDNPTSVYFKNGYLYISDMSNSRIVLWKEGDSEGKTLLGVGGPNCITLDNFGNLYILGNLKITKYDITKKITTELALINRPEDKFDQFRSMSWIKCDNEGSLYVADVENNRIQKYSFENSPIFTPTKPGNYTATVTTQFGKFITPIFKVLVQDTDKDGVEDSEDKCLNTPSGEQVDSNGCSLSQKDTDNDGVNDKVDKCSTTKTGFKVDANGCADYQKDSDNDGITDDIDKCQGTPSGIKVDTFGCSDAQKDTCTNVKPTIILKNGLELSTPLVGVGYNWYLNEIKIPNANTSSYLATASGRYSVQVLKTATCITGISENIFVQITGTTEENNQFIVFPNPFTKDIKIEFPPEYGLAVKVSISDIKGSIVYSKERVINSEIINLSNFSTGTYFLTIYSNNSSEKRVFKLLKE